jgi:hypothetical protein
MSKPPYRIRPDESAASNRLKKLLYGSAWLLLALSLALPASATVTVSGPDDGSAFFNLDMPTGQFDERGLSGFEFLISSVPQSTDPFTANDQYLIRGEDTNPIDAIGNDLGAVGDLSGVPFDFSIQHNLVGGRNFTFSLTNSVTSAVSVLCWGVNCPAGSNAAEMINGEGPLIDYNGIQVQARAQDVVGSSVDLQILSLSGVTLAGSPLFNETVTPSSPGTIFSFDLGRRGQWFLADDLDFHTNEWELLGQITLNRPDEALMDRTKVRLAIDFVRDPSLPSVVPEPSTALLMGLGLLALAANPRRA